MTGQTIVLDGQSYTVAGVLPVSFVFPMDVKVDVMATLPVSPTASHHDLSMSIWAVYGRLKPGVTISQARADAQLLGRWSARSGELAVRTAIGAGSGRLMRQLFTEATLLAVAGSALGLALASAMLHGFAHFAAGELPRLSEVTMDLRVFLIALLICILTTVALGALPADAGNRGRHAD